MAGEYTPTTEDVRLTYASDSWGNLREGWAAEFSRWLAAHDAETREQTLAPIRAALDGHPACDVHPDDDPVSCGWKRAVAVADVRRALDA